MPLIPSAVPSIGVLLIIIADRQAKYVRETNMLRKERDESKQRAKEVEGFMMKAINLNVDAGKLEKHA
eukprot:3128718-Rhodomonas_salina.3